MSISKDDLGELNRLLTNTYGDDRVFLSRLVVGIHAMEREILSLKAELKELKPK